MISHTESDWIIDREATCTNVGRKHTECTVCHEKINSEDEIEKLQKSKYVQSETRNTFIEVREEFLQQFIYEAGIRTPKYRDLVFQYLNSFKNPLELVLKTMEGIQVSEINQKLKKTDKSLVDLVTEEYHPLAKVAKDTSAAAVLVFAIVAIIVGLIIFVPKIIGLF